MPTYWTTSGLELSCPHFNLEEEGANNLKITAHFLARKSKPIFSSCPAYVFRFLWTIAPGHYYNEHAFLSMWSSIVRLLFHLFMKWKLHIWAYQAAMLCMIAAFSERYNWLNSICWWSLFIIDLIQVDWTCYHETNSKQILGKIWNSVDIGR